MFPFVIKAKEILLDILFPPLCLNCQKHLETRIATNANINTNSREYKNYLCDNCYSLIKLNNTLFCPVCRARLADNKRICHYDSQYLLAAAGNYDDPVLQNLIHYFKYKSFKNLSLILGEIAAKYIENCKLKIENFVVVPIPLHPRRQRERGFNQAKLLAEITAKNSNLELEDCLKRIKNTKPQSQLKDSEKRRSNVFNCFSITSPDFVKGKNIILVDDVFTSGATMNEAVKILKQNGAKRIIALVVAKA